MAVQEVTTGGGVAQWKKFFREVKIELKKVTWPNRQQLIAYTGVVFVAVVIVSSLIWVIDTSFTYIFRWLMKI